MLCVSPNVCTVEEYSTNVCVMGLNVYFCFFSICQCRLCSPVRVTLNKGRIDKSTKYKKHYFHHYNKCRWIPVCVCMRAVANIAGAPEPQGGDPISIPSGLKSAIRRFCASSHLSQKVGGKLNLASNTCCLYINYYKDYSVTLRLYVENDFRFGNFVCYSC